MAESEEVGKGVRFEFTLRDSRDCRYIGNLHISFADKSAKTPYKIGDLIKMPDGEIFRNNSKRLRECYIEKILNEKGSNIPTVYIRPVKQEAKCYGDVIGKTTFEKIINRIDWSGSDGWLRL